MEGSCAMSVDAISAKLVQAIKENDLETFKATLPTAVSGEVISSISILKFVLINSSKSFKLD